MITILIGIIVLGILGYSDYKRMSLSNRAYYTSIISLIIAMLLGFIINFKVAFVSLVIGAMIYLIMSWYINEFVAEVDKVIIGISLITFPVPAIAGLASVALRGAWRGRRKYFPALAYFAIAFIIVAFITMF
jgi:hypothetical protein